MGQTHLSGTAETLVGGDPGVPMSHTNLEHSLLILKMVYMKDTMG